MKMKPGELRLYAVTDRAWAHTMEVLEGQIAAAIKGGATFVQLREKDMQPREFLTEANWVVRLCHSMGVRCVINDNVDVALLSHADGVHIGQDDMDCKKARVLLGEGKIIGVSAHTVDEAIAAEAAGADYLGSGAAFPTDTKAVSGHLHPEDFKAICSAVKIPVVAIGGITRDNISTLNGVGLAGAAVVSALFAQSDVEAAAREMRALCERL